MTWNASPELISAVHALRERIQPIRVDTPLRELLSDHFPRDCSSLPISGGWGYSPSEAICFVSDLFPKNMPRDFIGLQYHIAQKIAYEELIIFQPKGDGFSGIQLKLRSHALLAENGKHYDRLDFTISCWSDSHWDVLKNEWESNDSGQRAGFDLASHEAKRAATQISYERTLWFDITEVFGHN